MPKNITLIDCLQAFIAYSHKKGIKSFPFPFDPSWQLLFYEFAKEFSQELRFDWDGPHPVCQKLRQAITQMLYTFRIFTENDNRRLQLSSSNITRPWERNFEENRELFDLVQRMYEHARDMENFFEHPTVVL